MRGKYNCMKKGLAVGIIALLFVTSVTPVVFGYELSVDVEEDFINYDVYQKASFAHNYRYHQEDS